MTPGEAVEGAAPPRAGSPWAPFRYAAFTVLWLATLVSNVGTWMYNTASSWLMTGLAPDPFVVAMVQVAATLPMFLFALPSGALADVVDRRRLLIVVEIATSVICAGLSALVWLDLVTPSLLLLFTFLIGVGSVLIAPAWQAVVPELVPKADLAPAVTLNSVGFNISRAIGPALGGAVIATLGIAAPFWLNTIGNLAVVGALVWWRPPERRGHHLPAERLWAAMVSGIRHGRHNAPLRATMVRAVSFFVFAGAYWALLPLVARDRIGGGPEVYGILLGAIGSGAVAGAFVLAWLKDKLGPDRLVAAGTLGTALALVGFGLAKSTAVALCAGVLAGAAWIAVLASLNVSAQVALPEWVRGRGLALYMTVMFGALTLSSAVWGKAADVMGLPAAHLAAAAGALAMIPLTWRWKLQTGAAADLTPSLHWPAPAILHEIEPDRGPVLVTVEYRVRPADRAAFLAALQKLGPERRRDGAYAWGIFEDTASEGRFVETFYVESWVEHLRQHERVTNADRLLQDAVAGFHVTGTPKVSHFVAV
ncbi:MAG TPA: MFS transporter [Alphaproteobacteria bacterium]